MIAIPSSFSYKAVSTLLGESFSWGTWQMCRAQLQESRGTWGKPALSVVQKPLGSSE